MKDDLRFSIFNFSELIFHFSIFNFMTEKIKHTLRESVAARWAVLLLLAVTMFFIGVFADVLAPMAMHLEVAFGWSPATYGTVSGSMYILNVLGFVLLAGIILDRIGARKSTLIASVLVIFGAGIKYYGMTDYFNNGGFGFAFFDSILTHIPASAKVAIVGFAIFGVGLEMAVISTMRAIIRWFKGKELALALAMQVSVGRLGIMFTFFFAPRWAETSGISSAVGISTLLLLVGLFTACMYFIMDLKLDKQEGKEKETDEDEFKFSDIKLIFSSRTFWIVAGLCVFYYISIWTFQRFAVGMLDSRLIDAPMLSSDIFALFPLGAAILTPLLGFFLDFRGRGATMLIWGSLLMVVCHATFAIMPESAFTFPVAVGAIVLLGVSFSLVPAALWPAIPKIIEQRMLGTAYALIFWIQNVGLTFAPILIGSVLVATNPYVDVEAGDVHSFKYPMLIFASFGVVALILSFLLKRQDKIHGYGLELPNKQK